MESVEKVGASTESKAALQDRKIEVVSLNKLEKSTPPKAYLPAEFEFEKVANEAINEDLNKSIESVSPRAASEKELGENIQIDLENQIEAAKKETDALYEIAKEVESTKSPQLEKTATALVDELKKIQSGGMKLTPAGYAKVEKDLISTLEDLGYEVIHDSKGLVEGAVKTSDVNLSRSIEVKKRLNKIINYDLLETGAQDFLKSPTAALREDIRNGYGKESKARKAFEEAERKYGQNAEKRGKKSITSMRYSEKPESIAKLIRTPSALQDVKNVASKDQFAQIERELLEHMNGLPEQRAQAFFREVRPQLNAEARSVGEQILESKIPKASPAGKAAQREKIQNMVLDDISKSTITGERPTKALDLWKTSEGQQLIKQSLEGNPNKKEVLKYLSDQSFNDFTSSIISPLGEVNFTKLNNMLKDPATISNLRMVAGEEGVNFLRNLEQLTNRVKKNADILERTIAKSTSKERKEIEGVLKKRGEERFKKAKGKRDAVKADEKALEEAKEKASFTYKLDEFLDDYGVKTKGLMAALGIWKIGTLEGAGLVAAFEIFKKLSTNKNVQYAFKNAAAPKKSSAQFLRSIDVLSDAME
jgi:hypothetical protein